MTDNPFPIEAIDASSSEIAQILAAVFAANPFPQGSDKVTGGFGFIGDSFKVTGSGSSVSLAPGIGVAAGIEASAQHAATLPLSAPHTIGSIPTAGTQRYDIVYAGVRDEEYPAGGVGNNDRVISRQPGTASSTPVDPTLPVFAREPIARLRVNNTGVYQIDDLRRVLTAQGGEVRCTSLTRPDWAWIGLRIYETDTGRHLVYYGTTTGWQKQWNSKWGLLVPPIAVTVPESFSLGSVDNVDGSAATVSLPANRYVKVTAKFLLNGGGGASNPRIVPVLSAGSMVAGTAFIRDGLAAGEYKNGDLEFVVQTVGSGLPASYSFGLAAYNSGGANGFRFANDVTWTTVLVEDNGEAGPPV